MSVIAARAQVGVGTTSPVSTLDVRGSLSTAVRSFTGTTSIASSDHTVIFTGTSAVTATLPDATACAGRIYCIKNYSTTSAALTIATTSSQTIDGSTTWLMNQTNESAMLISDGANWEVYSLFTGYGSGTAWIQGGNSVSAVQKLGTTTAYDLPFITSNTERMRITSAGNVGIGSTGFSANPEALLVYQNSSTSFNVIGGKGNLNNYLQLNIQNQNSGANASSDVVATADNGNESNNYVDLGINSSAYNTSSITGGPDNAYLYSAANDFVIGNSTANKNLVFFTGGTAAANERMLINGTGNVGIGSSSFSSNPEALLVYQNSASSYNVIGGKGSLNNYLQLNIQNLNGGNTASSDLVATANNGSETTNYVDLGINSSGYSQTGILGGHNVCYLYGTGNDFVIGNSASGNNLVFFTDGTATTNERMRIATGGNVGINNSSPQATLDVNGTVKLGSSGTALNGVLRFTNQSATDNTSFDYTSERTLTFNLSGVSQYASVIVTPRGNLPGTIFIQYAYVPAANTVKVMLGDSGGPDILGTMAFDFTIIQ